MSRPQRHASPPRRRRRLTRRALLDLLLVSLSAILTFTAFPTAFAPEVDLFYLIWFSHVPLLWVLRDKAPKAAFYWGWLAGTLINVGGYHWLAEMLETFGHLPSPIAWLLMILHGAWMGVLWALWAFLVNRIVNTTRVPLEWAAPLAMVAVEIAVPRIFPAYMGNSQASFPLVMQVVDLLGVPAVTFLIYRVNAVLYLWVRAKLEGRRPPMRATKVTAVMLAVVFLYGGARMYQIDRRMADAPKLRLGIVEADVGIFQKEPEENIQNHLLKLQRLSAQAEAEGAELILWSESAYRFEAIPRHARHVAPSKAALVKDYRQDIIKPTPISERAAPIRGFKTPLIFGGTSLEPRATPRWEGDAPFNPYNSAWLLAEDGAVLGRYDKVKPLVFGEYIPFVEYFPWIYKYIPTAGNLEAGTEVKVMETTRWGEPVRLAVSICYEGILSSFMRSFSGQSPHLIINMTNDDWFGQTAERYLHLILAMPRAIEHRLAMARPTLTGVSAFIDANGRLIKQTRPTGAETLLWSAPLLQSQTLYQLIGEAFAYFCLLLTLGLYLWGRWRRR
ncbi:apolipoprotein N-acyltransferase [Myxococcota bacterium]|nr:apolipoprotein N-acyltransferase [Myxococcota bacterium]MBU1433144.1 apolipoprotein N-acyltransferase [Myxococcota bacterium]MBU1896339.1 apolipoprotein N-acyltransferase [Myxococcota bacterium]